MKTKILLLLGELGKEEMYGFSRCRTILISNIVSLRYGNRVVYFNGAMNFELKKEEMDKKYQEKPQILIHKYLPDKVRALEAQKEY